MIPEPPFRSIPTLEGDAAYFWTGGAVGELRILRCRTCGFWLHPPEIICPECLSRDLRPQVTSGTGTVYSFAVNHHVADPRVQTPYLIALVDLVEQPGLRVTTNLVNCAPGDVEIGMPVEVAFEQHDDVFVPVFQPRRSSGGMDNAS